MVFRIKISGVLDQQYAMFVGVSNQSSELLAIFNHAIQYTTELERQQILHNWLSVDPSNQLDQLLFWQILVAILIISGLLLYCYRVVHSHNRRLQQSNSKLEKLSHSYQLTGITNRHSLHQRLATEMQNSQLKSTFSLILIDVDHFKEINDAFGHDFGDRVIQEIANLLMAMLRQNDLVGRWGGEEFLNICSQTTAQGATQLAEQIRLQMLQHDFSVVNPISVIIDISQHVAGESVDACLKRADDALYRAKYQGRNQTVLATSAALS